MPTAAVRCRSGAGLRALPALLTASEGWAGLRAALAAGHSGTIDGAWGSAGGAGRRGARGRTRRDAARRRSQPGRRSTPWAEDLASFTGTAPGVFEAWEGWPVSAQQGEARPDHHRPGCGCSSNSRPIRPRSSSRRSRRSASRCRSAPTSRRAAGSSRAGEVDRPGRTGRVARRQRLQARRGGRVPGRVRAPRRHLRRLPARRRRPRAARVLRRRARIDPHLRRRDAAQPGEAKPAVDAAECRGGDAAAAAVVAGLPHRLPPRRTPGSSLVEPDDLKEQAKHFLERVADADRAVLRRGRVRATCCGSRT